MSGWSRMRELLSPASTVSSMSTVAKLGVALAAVVCLGSSVPTTTTDGRVARVIPSARPTVEAAFPRESYRAGDVARLRLFEPVAAVRVRLFRAGTEHVSLSPRDLMLGTPVGPPIDARRTRSIALQIGDWPSGLYYARLTSSGRRVGFAPFVLRPRVLGENRVAVVMPTLTWQAYNFRDDDGDGTEDTWYADPTSTARLARPFQNRGVPPHYKYYDQPFLRWLQETGRTPDYLAQADADQAGGIRLRQAYDLIVFPGHHEYVTTREYDAVESFRNRGGNLMFLSANNFFWKVVKHGSVMRRVARWREIGRPEASLVGVQYIGNDEGERRGAWIVTRAGASHWAFSGVGVHEGSAFAEGGIEIDRKAPSSPPGTKVLAEIRDLLGPGKTAQMTYYATRDDAQVFASGAFTLAGAALWPGVRRLLHNVWTRLSANELARGN